MDIDFKITHREEQDCVDKGYKYLGWQLGLESPDFKKCYEAGHMGHQSQEKRRVKSKQHSQRGSDCTYWCDDCRIWWKIDMSD